ncbi:hypothetical protein EVAR_84796_1 [Eumeta japonica]|uniref:Uncharacterized protein n=1 Tax=Eumeta variegata TaxID=151549 RepID=A0A4C1U9I5_EUMVA|nr:hypothetical protein EVAR_84796_1 [Eumeta japonica]
MGQAIVAWNQNVKEKHCVAAGMPKWRTAAPLLGNGGRPWARARYQFIIQSHVANWFEVRGPLNPRQRRRRRPRAVNFSNNKTLPWQ